MNKSEMGIRKTKKSAPETVSVQDEHLQTVISSADSTNVLLSFQNPPILENESSQNIENATSIEQKYFLSPIPSRMLDESFVDYAHRVATELGRMKVSVCKAFTLTSLHLHCDLS